MTPQENNPIYVNEFDELLNKKLIKKYCSYHDRFKKIENESTCTRIAPVGKYIVVRVDGVGMRNRYLNDSIKNFYFNKIMDYAVRETYFVTHRKAPTNSQQIYIGATSTSDEAIFIFNTNNNYFQRDILYTVSLIASTFTSYFSKMAERIAKRVDMRPITGAFTAKPFIFDSLNDVVDYIDYRAAFAARHQLTKELRLDGFDAENLRFKTHLYDLDYYFDQLEQYGVLLSSINKHFSIYSIDSELHHQLNVSRSSCFNKMTLNMIKRFKRTERHTFELNNSDRNKCNNRNSVVNE